MKYRFSTLALIVGISLFSSCNSSDYQQKANNSEYLHAGIRRITDIIRHDIFAPPVSSRIYVYSAVAAYEALVPGFPEYQSLAGQLNGLTPGPQPEAGKEYCFPLASTAALMVVGKQLVFSVGTPHELESHRKPFDEAAGKRQCRQSQVVDETAGAAALGEERDDVAGRRLRHILGTRRDRHRHGQ